MSLGYFLFSLFALIIGLMTMHSRKSSKGALMVGFAMLTIVTFMGFVAMLSIWARLM